MRAHAFAAPVVPGKESVLQAFEEELATHRLEEMNDLRRRLGITREVGYLQKTPDAPSLYLLYHEGDGVDAVDRTLAASDHPFDRWFVGKLSEIHGFQPGGSPPPPSELVLETEYQGRNGDFYLFAVPVAAGQLDGWLRFTSDLKGSRRGAYEESRRRIGFGEKVFLQRTPNADIVIPCIRGEEPAQDLATLAASDHPFDRWFIAEISKYHGIDFTQPPPAPNARLVLWEAPAPITA